MRGVSQGTHATVRSHISSWVSGHTDRSGSARIGTSRTLDHVRSLGVIPTILKLQLRLLRGPGRLPRCKAVAMLFAFTSRTFIRQLGYASLRLLRERGIT